MKAVASEGCAKRQNFGNAVPTGNAKRFPHLCIILGKAMNEFNELCVFLGSWYTDNKIGDGLSISDKFQCFIGFTNFVVTVVYIVFLLPSN